MTKKKILILGGFAQICDIIQDAVDAGHHVIVTDNVADSPGKKIASEHHMVSITDVKGLIDLCRDRNVDAIMNYCIHSGQKPYQQVCEALGLPCYGSARQFDILSDKSLFKDACIEHQIDIVPALPTSLEDLMALPETDFPLVIKPADGRASKGVSICYFKHELKDALESAEIHSANGDILSEKYMTGPEVAVKYFVVNGQIYLTSMSDIYTYYSCKKRVYIWSQTFPSKSYGLLLEETDDKLRAFIKALGIMNGPLSFSGFVDGSKFRFIDPSFRMGGAQDWLIVEKITGINISQAMTRFALTGSMGDPDNFNALDKRINEKASAMLYFLVRPGIISEIHGVQEAANTPSVIDYHQCHPVGHEVKHFGSSDHVALRFLLVADCTSELKESMYAIQKKVRILDERGENMILPNFDPELLN
jgi:biotin carboxylase